MAARHTSRSEDPGLSLALAMVVSSKTPLLLLDGKANIVAASDSFCSSFGISSDNIAGRPFSALGNGEWNTPRLHSLINATISGDAVIDAYEMDLERKGKPPRSLLLNVQRLAYGGGDQFRLTVSVEDVTKARISERKTEDLVRQNDLLMQEVRHRVANSLQIIASVLMQNARRASTNETREQLRDAHQRVLSIAELQHQLAASTKGEVHIRAYLTKLCATIAASMIAPPSGLTLDVVADDVIVDAGASVSMGLIVTELVINALKHAFPDGKGGAVTVAYRTAGEAWTLSVSDTGVGMPADMETITTGLGTSIIEALARQMKAKVVIASTDAGASISIVHKATHAKRTLRTDQPERGAWADGKMKAG